MNHLYESTFKKGGAKNLLYFVSIITYFESVTTYILAPPFLKVDKDG
jgi:hypothetical protein